MENQFLVFLDSMITCEFSRSVKNKFSCEYMGGVYSDDILDRSIFSETFNAWDCWEGLYPFEPNLPEYDCEFEDELNEYAVEILHMMQRHNIPDFDCRVHIYYKHIIWWKYYLDTRSINCVIFGDIPHESFNCIIY